MKKWQAVKLQMLDILYCAKHAKERGMKEAMKEKPVDPHTWDEENTQENMITNLKI